MKRTLKIVGMAVGAVVALVVVLLGFTQVKWFMHRHRTYAVPAIDLRSARGDPARGEYLVKVGVGCVECHGDDLAGGTVVEDPVAGHIYGPNITPAALKDWTDAEIAGAIHHGVHRNGRALFIMPSDNFQYLCLQDVADMIAFLRRTPPVARANRRSRVGPVIKVMWAAGQVTSAFPAETVDHGRPFTARVPEGPTRAYGAYLYKSHCAGCHRDDARGGKVTSGPPDWPPAANLTMDGAGGWTRAQFVRALRTGINPSGSKIRPPMGDAIRRVGPKMKENDLKALWEYLHTVDGRPAGF